MNMRFSTVFIVCLSAWVFATGAASYPGESNRSKAAINDPVLTALARDWRSLRDRGVPFLFVGSGTGEPMNDADMQAQNRYADKISAAEYARWHAYVMSRPPGEQVWLRTLEEQLGSFYGPAYIKDILANSANLAPDKDAWAYVPDDPQRPRVLVLGDSISRSYTAPLRVRLKGLANVHRAPANCMRTDRFFEHGETWLMQNGSNQWDYITVNYGIHDHGKSPEAFTDNLKRILSRLGQTGAKVFWVRTTPWSNREDGKEIDLSAQLNQVADALAAELGLTVIDLHTPMTAERERLQFSDNCHFNDEGAALMGDIMAAAINAHLGFAIQLGI
jgi:hypothetical protein